MRNAIVESADSLHLSGIFWSALDGYLQVDVSVLGRVRVAESQREVNIPLEVSASLCFSDRRIVVCPRLVDCSRLLDVRIRLPERSLATNVSASSVRVVSACWRGCDLTLPEVGF